MQRDFFHGTVATVAYVGTKGPGCRRLPALTSCLTRALRIPIPSCRESRLPTARHHELQLQRIADLATTPAQEWVGFNVNYTWAHAMTNVGGIGEGMRKAAASARAMSTTAGGRQPSTTASTNTTTATPTWIHAIAFRSP